jgi:hypothetical protein
MVSPAHFGAKSTPATPPPATQWPVAGSQQPKSAQGALPGQQG